MKLKTLKDLEKEDYIMRYKFANRLREEAIKWVKEDFEDIKNNPLLGVETAIATKILSRWIKRFNITEEELK